MKNSFQQCYALFFCLLLSVLLSETPAGAGAASTAMGYDAQLEACALDSFAQESFSCMQSQVKEAMTRCIMSSEPNGTTALRMIAPGVPFSLQLESASVSFTSSAGLPPVSWTLPSTAEIPQVMSSDLLGPRTYHAYVLPSHAIGDMTAHFGIAQDLSELTAADVDLNWSGLLPLYRDVLAVYDGAVLAIPTQGTMMQLYYRRDLLAAAGLEPPRTWTELLSVAAVFNGTDLNNDGVPDYGICMWRTTCNGSSDPLGAVLASLVQSQGRHSGLFFEPETMRPVWDTVAWDAALRITRLLTGVAAPVSSEPASETTPCFSQPLYSQGRCAMALALAGQFKSDSWPSNPRSIVRGLIGTSILPGSEFVLDWQQNALVRCDADICPYATHHTVFSTGSNPEVSNSSSSSPDANATAPPVRRLQTGRRMLETQERQVQDGDDNGAAAKGETSMWVNRAPYATTGGQSIFISRLQSVPQRLAAYNLVVEMVRDAGNWPLVAGPGTEFGPTRQEHLDSVGKWAEYGYHPDDLASFLAAARESLASGNVAMDLRSVGGAIMRELMIAIAGMVANTSIPIEDATLLSRQMLTAVISSSLPADQLRSSYMASINFRTLKPPPPANTQPPKSPSQSPKEVGLRALAASVAGAVALALVATFVVWQLVASRKLRRRFGRITAPGVGPSTTICVTDIEGSTRLWETLPSEVMSQALQLHNQCIRQCATAHNGYESAWEGDSVILCFHSAEEAVAFSVSVQDKLMWLPWPEQLLEVDICQPLWVASSKAPEAALQRRSGPHLSLHAASVNDTGDSGNSQLTPPPAAAAEVVPRAASPGGSAVPDLVDRKRFAPSWRKGLSCSAPASGGQAQPSRFSIAAGSRVDPSNSSRRNSAAGLAPMRFALPTEGGTSETISAGRPRLILRAYHHLADAVKRRSSRPLGHDGGEGSPRAAGSTASGHETPSEIPQTSHDSLAPESPTLPSRSMSFIDAADFGSIAGGVSGPEPRRSPPASLARHGCGAILLAASFGRKVVTPPCGPGGNGELSVSSRVFDQQPPPPGATSDSPRRSTVLELYRSTFSFASPAAELLAEQSGLAGRTGCSVNASREAPSAAPASGGLHDVVGHQDQQPCNGSSPRRTANTEDESMPSVTGVFFTAACRQGNSGGGAPCLTSGASGGKASLSQSPSVRQRNATWAKAPGGGRLLLRGLRVRIGCHSGVYAAADVVNNRASARVAYTGAPMARARAVVSATHGGMVLVSGATHALLAAKAAGTNMSCVVLPSKGSDSNASAQGILFWHAGVHHLDDQLSRPLDVYMVATPSLAPRWAVLAAPGPAARARTVADGVAAAPVGHVCVSAITVSGGAAIAAWNIGLWRESTALLWREAAKLCAAHGGFLATTRAGVGAVPSQGRPGGAGRHAELLLMAAFPDAAAAVRWSAGLIAHGLLANWPTALLVHEMAEEQLWLAAMPEHREADEQRAAEPQGDAFPGMQQPQGPRRRAASATQTPVAEACAATQPHLSTDVARSVDKLQPGPRHHEMRASLLLRAGMGGASLLESPAQPALHISAREKAGTDPGEVHAPACIADDHPRQTMEISATEAVGPAGTTRLYVPYARSTRPKVADDAACDTGTRTTEEAAGSSSRTFAFPMDSCQRTEPAECGSGISAAPQRGQSRMRETGNARAVNLQRGANSLLANMSMRSSSAILQFSYITGSVASSSSRPMLPARVPVREEVRLPGHDAMLERLLSLPSGCSTYLARTTASAKAESTGARSGGGPLEADAWPSMAVPLQGVASPVVVLAQLPVSDDRRGLQHRTGALGLGQAVEAQGVASCGAARAIATERFSVGSLEATSLAEEVPAPASNTAALLHGTAVRPTAVQLSTAPLGGDSEEGASCSTTQVARIFAAHRTRQNSKGEEDADHEGSVLASPSGSVLSLALLDRLIARGLRLRAGVEMGSACVEVNCVSGDARYGGPAAVGAVALAERAPVSRVFISPAVMTALREASIGGRDGSCNASTLADLHPSMAARISVFVRR